MSCLKRDIFFPKLYGNKKAPHPIDAGTHFITSLRSDPSANGTVRTGRKTQLMTSRLHVNRFIVFAFVILVAVALIYGIKATSVTGIILSLTSLGAGIHFLNILNKANRELEQEQEEIA